MAGTWPSDQLFVGSRCIADALRFRRPRSLQLAPSVGIEQKVSSTCRKGLAAKLSSSPSSPRVPSIPSSTYDSSEAVAMSSNLMNQSPEDQFLYWCQKMEKKQEEQAR